MRLTLTILLAAALAAPGVASAAPAASRAAIARPLDADALTRNRAVLRAIDRGDWASASATLDAMPSGPLTAWLRAELYLAKGSPRVEAVQLLALLGDAPDLPQAPALVRLASARGVDAPVALPAPRDLRWLGSAPRRVRVAAVEPTGIGAQIAPLIKEDRPAEAEALLATASLGPADLAVWQHRVAWSHFLTGDDRAARTLADKARAAGGDAGAQGHWVYGLAAWRQKDWTAAADAFAALTQAASDPEMVAAGHYWASRALTAARQPARVQAHLQQASRLSETFYGMLAHAAMGLAPAKRDRGAAMAAVAAAPNIRAAAALAQMGEDDRADTLIRWQARIGLPVDHAALAMIAGTLDLPATQLYLAHHGPAGAVASAEARYPMPDGWLPEGGWRVDKALVFAHALEESRFRVKALSPAGAQGLMQVLPSTAALVARRKGQSFAGSLNAPATNMEIGQSYIEQLRDSPTTGGLLPKVIAAYNAGPRPIDRWNARGDALNRDPLLYIESISYWETRGYVTTVLRNYWMYQQQQGVATPSRDALVQGLWPKFPGAK